MCVEGGVEGGAGGRASGRGIGRRALLGLGGLVVGRCLLLVLLELDDKWFDLVEGLFDVEVDFGRLGKRINKLKKKNNNHNNHNNKQ